MNIFTDDLLFIAREGGNGGFWGSHRFSERWGRVSRIQQSVKEGYLSKLIGSEGSHKTITEPFGGDQAINSNTHYPKASSHKFWLFWSPRLYHCKEYYKQKLYTNVWFASRLDCLSFFRSKISKMGCEDDKRNYKVNCVWMERIMM